jgi:hypothetical protein
MTDSKMRLRFTIRDLLWLTVVVALAVGWWLDRARIEEKRQALKSERLKYTRAIKELVERMNPTPPPPKPVPGT